MVFQRSIYVPLYYICDATNMYYWLSSHSRPNSNHDRKTNWLSLQRGPIGYQGKRNQLANLRTKDEWANSYSKRDQLAIKAKGTSWQSGQRANRVNWLSGQNANWQSGQKKANWQTLQKGQLIIRVKGIN